MIYCGYQGVGKTSHCRVDPDFTEIESSDYKKVNGWQKKYIKDAFTALRKYKHIFLSAHPIVIKELQKLNIPFVLIIPDKNKKKEWNLRLKLRYEITKEQYAYNALADFKKNFNKDMKFYDSLTCKKIVVRPVRVATTLTDLLTIKED